MHLNQSKVFELPDLIRMKYKIIKAKVSMNYAC
jgi:hypothetical protein